MKKLQWLSATALAIISVSPALAQEKAKPADDAAAASDSDEIVVTAQRTNQSVQTVPISITAFDTKALERQQIRNTSDLQLTLPNISFTKTTFTSSSFNIRGVGDLCVGTSCDQALGVHMNNSPIPGTRLFETEFMDVERIEILRGPQGTLYGRNATSGVMNVITNKPDLSAAHASAEGEYGNFSTIKLKGMFNVPIGDTLGVRVAGQYHRGDGYTLNLYNNTRVDDRDLFSVRASLRWQPTADTTIDLMGYYFREHDHRLRIQKQLCHRDPTGILGCLPDSKPAELVNANAQVTSTLPSVQLLRASAGALGPVFAPLGLVNLYGPDTNSGQLLTPDPRQINSPFTPQYYTREKQIQATFSQNFGDYKLEVQGMWNQNTVNGQVDPGQTVANRAVYATALNTLNAYAGASPLPAVLMPASFWAQARNALIPAGANGVLCTTASSASNTGIFGGNSICGAAPIAYDESIGNTENWSAEVILSSKLKGPFNFLVGGTYLSGKSRDNHYYVNSFGLDYAAAVLGLLQTVGQRNAQLTAGGPAAVTFPNSYLGPPDFDSNTSNYGLKSYGLFGEAYYEPSDKMKVTLGLRYNHDSKTLQARGQLLNFLIPYGTPDAFSTPFGAQYDADPFSACPAASPVGAVGSVAGCDAYQLRDVSFSALTGRLVVDYKFTPKNMIYASYSRGYKSGGINPPLQANLAAPNAFRPEFINAFEIGTKNSFMDGKMTLNASAFYYQYKGLQLSRIVNRTSINDNVDADIYGLEVEGSLRPAKGWLMNFGGSLLKTKVVGDLFVQNPRDPAVGRSDVVIIKDLQAAFSCVVAPTGNGTATQANTFVTLINTSAGLVNPSTGSAAPVPFPAGSGVTATGAYGFCGTLASTIASAPPAIVAALGLAPGSAIPLQVVNVGLSQNIRGKELPGAPQYKFNAGIQYTAELDNGMSITPRFDYIVTGKSYGNIFNGFVNEIPAFAQMNAQIQLNGQNDRWFLRGYIQNITNNSAITGLGVGDQSQGVFTNIFTLEPRRYGVAVGVKF